MTGRITKSIAGDFWVESQGETLVTKPRGIFRHVGNSPVVGDYVDVKDLTIIKIHGRKNKLIRPNIANVDGALLIFSLLEPRPDFMILDTLLVNILSQDIEPLLVFNKADLVDQKHIDGIKSIYSSFNCLFLSTLEKDDMELLLENLKPGLYVLAGPSGAGKSSMINSLMGKEVFKVGELSERIKRGKHTTRHHELIELKKDVYLADTPGFQTLELSPMEASELGDYYPEFDGIDRCRFDDCLHDKEPGCSVKQAFYEEEIAKSRYLNYLALLAELRSRKDY